MERPDAVMACQFIGCEPVAWRSATPGSGRGQAVRVATNPRMVAMPHPHEAAKIEVTDGSFLNQPNWGGSVVLHRHQAGLKRLRAS